MDSETQETKFESLKVKTPAKVAIDKVVTAIQTKRGAHAEKPTISEAVLIMADHFLATA